MEGRTCADGHRPRALSAVTRRLHGAAPVATGAEPGRGRADSKSAHDRGEAHQWDGGRSRALSAVTRRLHGAAPVVTGTGPGKRRGAGELARAGEAARGRGSGAARGRGGARPDREPAGQPLPRPGRVNATCRAGEARVTERGGASRC